MTYSGVVSNKCNPTDRWLSFVIVEEYRVPGRKEIRIDIYVYIYISIKYS